MKIVFQTCEQSENIKKCFFKKFSEFEETHLDYMTQNNIELNNLFPMFTPGTDAEYGFRDTMRKLDDGFQKEAELFFNKAFCGCSEIVLYCHHGFSNFKLVMFTLIFSKPIGIK